MSSSANTAAVMIRGALLSVELVGTCCTGGVGALEDAMPLIDLYLSETVLDA